MTNAWLSDTQFFGITGFFLRQLALDALVASNVNKEDAVKTITDEASIFADKVLGQVSSEKNSLQELWIGFSIVIEKSRKVILPEDEKNSYSTNVEYTNDTVQKILKILFSAKENLTYATNNLIKGTLSEIGRVSKTYGIKQSDLYVLSLLVMLDRIDEYVGTTALDKGDFGKRIEKEILPLVVQLEGIYAEGMNEEAVNKFMWDLIKIWRLCFVRFMEPRISSVQQSKQPIIEGKIKDELIEDLAEGIEKEIISE